LHIGEMQVVCPSVTSNSSLSFEAKELKFFLQTPHVLMPKKFARGFLKFCVGAEIWEFF